MLILRYRCNLPAYAKSYIGEQQSVRRGAISLQKYFTNEEKKVSKVALMLIFLGILSLTILTTPMAKAQGPSITVSPTQGQANTPVTVTLSGFSLGNTININIGGNSLTSIAFTDDPVSGTFYVPKGMASGTYTITGSDSIQESASTQFTVNGPSTTTAPTSAPTGTSGGSSTTTTSPPGYHYPTTPPVTTSNSGGLSPLLIGLVAVAIAFAAFMAVLYTRRGGGRQRPSYREESRYEPRPSAPSETSPPPASSYQSYQSTTMSAPSTGMSYSAQRASQRGTYSAQRMNRPSTSYTPTRSYQPSYQSQVNRQEAAYTKVCPHCERPVRDNTNICPNCSKRLR